MGQEGKAPERERRDWVLILLILLIGLLCVILAGGWAIRFSPTWSLDTDMGSNIDPNSDFLTNLPDGFIEPLDPSILTQPAWINVFLTPGASFETNIPVTSLPTNTPLPTNTTVPTAIISPTTTVIIPRPTNTLIYFPPSTNTPKPNTPVPSANLAITKDDGNTSYVAGGVLTYTITVTNNGPSAVTGATVTDNKPAQITSWSWACTAQNGGANGCDPVTNSAANFTDTVNLPNGASIVYTVTANVSGGATGNLVNTAAVAVPSGTNDPVPGNNSATDTDTLFTLDADLQILKDDLVTTYTPGNPVIYGIIVFNAGPNPVTGATVSDLLPEQITSASWTCAPLIGTGSCSTPSGSGSIVNHSINLPVGSSVVYEVTANIHASAVGNLVNTASVSVPAGYTDPNLTNNSDTDTDTPVGGGPDIDIGGPDGNDFNPGPNGSVTILFSPAIVGDGTSSPDFVYYEVASSPTEIDMDWVMIEISQDGITWYTVFVWGDGTPDTNSNLDINVIGGAETDNRKITSPPLYNQTGVTINIDGIVPAGS